MIYAGLALEYLIDKSKYNWLEFHRYDRATGEVTAIDVAESSATLPLRLLAVKPFSVGFSGNYVTFHYWG